MVKVRVYLKNTNSLSYPIVSEGLSGKKISGQIQFTHSEKSCDVEIDCEHLIEKEQFEKNKHIIFGQIWDVYNKLNTPRQKYQKKIRLNNRLN